MNEYDGVECPTCRGGINEHGFCSDCGFDYEEHLQNTDKFWSEFDENLTGNSDADKPASRPKG